MIVSWSHTNTTTNQQTKATRVQRNESKRDTRLGNPTLSPPLASRHQKGREDTYNTCGGRPPRHHQSCSSSSDSSAARDEERTPVSSSDSLHRQCCLVHGSLSVILSSE